MLNILSKIKKKLRELCTRFAEAPAPVQIITSPPNALEHLIASIDKKFGQEWDKTPTPRDSIETIMFRAGVKMYREQLLKELHVTHPQTLVTQPDTSRPS